MTQHFSKLVTNNIIIEILLVKETTYVLQKKLFLSQKCRVWHEVLGTYRENRSKIVNQEEK